MEIYIVGDNIKKFVESIRLLNSYNKDIWLTNKVDETGKVIGLETFVISANNVELVGLSFDEKFFKKFEAHEKPVKINIEELAKTDYSFISELAVLINQDTLTIKTISKEGDGVFEAGVIAEDYEGQRMPTGIPYTADIQIQGKGLYERMKTVLTNTENGHLIAKNGLLRVENENNGKKKAIEINALFAKINTVDNLTVQAGYEIKSIVEFLALAIKACDTSVVRFGQDVPLAIDMAGNDFRISYILAPRIKCD